MLMIIDAFHAAITLPPLATPATAGCRCRQRHDELRHADDAERYAVDTPPPLMLIRCRCCHERYMITMPVSLLVA